MYKGLGHIAEMAEGHRSPEIELLFSEGRERSFDTGEHLITEGATSGYVYDLLSGTVTLARNGRDGRRQILAFLGPRQFLGAASTPSYPNLATALTPVRAISYPRATLERVLDTSPVFAAKFRLVLIQILESGHDHIYTIGQKSAVERLASFLLYLRAGQAKYTSDVPRAESQHIDLPMTRLDIADFLGLTIETVSRAFSTLKKKNVINFSDSHSVDILEMDIIRELGGREDFTDRRGRA